MIPRTGLERAGQPRGTCNLGSLQGVKRPQGRNGEDRELVAAESGEDTVAGLEPGATGGDLAAQLVCHLGDVGYLVAGHRGTPAHAREGHQLRPGTGARGLRRDVFLHSSPWRVEARIGGLNGVSGFYPAADEEAGMKVVAELLAAVDDSWRELTPRSSRLPGRIGGEDVPG